MTSLESPSPEVFWNYPCVRSNPSVKLRKMASKCTFTCRRIVSQKFTETSQKIKCTVHGTTLTPFLGACFGELTRKSDTAEDGLARILQKVIKIRVKHKGNFWSAPLKFELQYLAPIGWCNPRLVVLHQHFNCHKSGGELSLLIDDPLTCCFSGEDIRK